MRCENCEREFPKMAPVKAGIRLVCHECATAAHDDPCDDLRPTAADVYRAIDDALYHGGEPDYD